MYIHVSKMREATRQVEESFPRPAMEGTEGRDEPIRISAILRREADGYRFAGHLSTSAGLACSLCNAISNQVLEIDFALRYKMAGNTTEPCADLPEDLELTRDECDVEELDDQGRIDMIRFSRDQIYLALPLQPRCREDCRGLCGLCGTDLNHATCTCTLPESDPRLAALAELRNSF